MKPDRIPSRAFRGARASPPGRTSSASAVGPRWPRRISVVIGTMMVSGAAINSVLVTVRPEVYSMLGTWFADLSPWRFGLLDELWDRTFSAHPRVWGALAGVGYEAAIGLLTLSRNPRRRLLGLGGVVLFKLGLLALGLWFWALPWLAVLIPTITATARTAARPGGRSPALTRNMPGR